MFNDVLATPITITEGGVTRTIDQRDALYKSMLLKAVKGDTRAAALIVRLMDQYGILRTERDKYPPFRIEIVKDRPPVPSPPG